MAISEEDRELLSQLSQDIRGEIEAGLGGLFDLQMADKETEELLGFLQSLPKE